MLVVFVPTDETGDDEPGMLLDVDVSDVFGPASEEAANATINPLPDDMVNGGAFMGGSLMAAPPPRTATRMPSVAPAFMGSSGGGSYQAAPAPRGSTGSSMTGSPQMVQFGGSTYVVPPGSVPPPGATPAISFMSPTSMPGSTPQPAPQRITMTPAMAQNYPPPWGTNMVPPAGVPPTYYQQPGGSDPMFQALLNAYGLYQNVQQIPASQGTGNQVPITDASGRILYYIDVTN